MGPRRGAEQQTIVANGITNKAVLSTKQRKWRSTSRPLAGSPVACRDRDEAQPRQSEDQAQCGQGRNGHLWLVPAEGEISAVVQGESGYPDQTSISTCIGRRIVTSDRPDGGVRREARQGEESGSAGRLFQGLRNLPPLPRRPRSTLSHGEGSKRQGQHDLDGGSSGCSPGRTCHV
jgi:hypothetical protein